MESSPPASRRSSSTRTPTPPRRRRSRPTRRTARPSSRSASRSVSPPLGWHAATVALAGWTRLPARRRSLKGWLVERDTKCDTTDTPRACFATADHRVGRPGRGCPDQEARRRDVRALRLLDLLVSVAPVWRLTCSSLQPLDPRPLARTLATTAASPSPSRPRASSRPRTRPSSRWRRTRRSSRTRARRSCPSRSPSLRCAPTASVSSQRCVAVVAQD